MLAMVGTQCVREYRVSCSGAVQRCDVIRVISFMYATHVHLSCSLDWYMLIVELAPRAS
jgi:hypothetical protein